MQIHQKLVNCTKGWPEISVIQAVELKGNTLTLEEAKDVIDSSEDQKKEMGGDSKEILYHFNLVMEILEKRFPKKLTDITEDFLFKCHEQIAIIDLEPGRVVHLFSY